MDRRPTGGRVIVAWRRAPGALAVAALLLLSLAACAHDYGLEDLEVPVHVWLRAPALVAQGGRLDALIYVDAKKAVEGPVTFAPGATYVELPPVYVPAGSRTVSAVFRGGAASATEEVSIDGETWVVVTVAGGSVGIEAEDRQPTP
jgi:hypothetical protein